LPNTTWSTWSGLTSLRCSAAFVAIGAQLEAEKPGQLAEARRAGVLGHRRPRAAQDDEVVLAHGVTP
jgi:hypothetical protein